MPAEEAPKQDWREIVHEVIFEADTPAGKLFDVGLLVAILASVLLVTIESVTAVRERYGTALYAAEWIFTILFTIEYVVRLICVKKPWRYAVSFFGIVDVLAILPTYLELLPFIGGTHSLLVIRALRLLRVFRIFKLGRFLSEAKSLRHALWMSRAKIIVFMTTVLIIVVIMGSAMYLVEGPKHGFTSIPQSMYWAIVTMTTVGYGDIAPVTPVGKMMAALIMILGYSLIIIPTGILSAEMAQSFAREPVTNRACPSCMREGQAMDAVFCKFCGDHL